MLLATCGTPGAYRWARSSVVSFYDVLSTAALKYNLMAAVIDILIWKKGNLSLWCLYKMKLKTFQQRSITREEKSEMRTNAQILPIFHNSHFNNQIQLYNIR